MTDDLEPVLSGHAAALQAAAARCRRCGSCQQVCPVFEDDPRERTSPRGRLQLLDAYLNDELSATPALAETLSLCLACGACAAQCPNGVRAGEVLLASRAGLRAQRRNRARRRAVAGVLGRPGLARTLASLGRGLRPLWARRVPADAGLHLRWTAGKVVQGRRFPPLARRFLGKLWRRTSPPVPLSAAERGDPARSAEDGSERPGPEEVVALFPGCVSTYLAPEAALAAKSALERVGARVALPGGLGCCGLAMLAAGDRKAALRALQRNLDALDPAAYDRVVTPCASCAAMLKVYAPALARELDEGAVRRAGEIAGKVQVLSQALASPGPASSPGEPVDAASTLTYHLPCHLAHALNDRDSGPRVLQGLAGARYAPATNMAQCCGHGGLFSLDHAPESARIGARKAAGLLATGAAAVVTECAGCWLQLYDLVGRENPGVEVLWLAEALERYGKVAVPGSKFPVPGFLCPPSPEIATKKSGTRNQEPGT